MSSQPKATDSGKIRNSRYRTCSLKLCYHLVVSKAVYIFLASVIAATLLQCLSRYTYPNLAAVARSALTVTNLPFNIAVLALAVALAMVYLSTRH